MPRYPHPAYAWYVGGVLTLAFGGVCYPLAGSAAWAAAWLVAVVIGFSAPFGVVVAAIQHLVPGPMRAQASALFLFVINLLGLGLGPFVAGWLSDRLSPGGHSLHLSLLVAPVLGTLGSAASFALGLKSCRRTSQALPPSQP